MSVVMSCSTGADSPGEVRESGGCSQSIISLPATIATRRAVGGAELHQHPGECIPSVTSSLLITWL